METKLLLSGSKMASSPSQKNGDCIGFTLLEPEVRHFLWETSRGIRLLLYKQWYKLWPFMVFPIKVAILNLTLLEPKIPGEILLEEEWQLSNVNSFQNNQKFVIKF